MAKSCLAFLLQKMSAVEVTSTVTSKKKQREQPCFCFCRSKSRREAVAKETQLLSDKHSRKCYPFSHFGYFLFKLFGHWSHSSKNPSPKTSPKIFNISISIGSSMNLSEIPWKNTTAEIQCKIPECH